GGAAVVFHRSAGGAAVFAGPGQPFNKVAGLGFADLDAASLDEMERVFDARDAELRVELATIADPHVGRLLTQRGYELAGYENVLGLALDAPAVAGPTTAPEDDVPSGVTRSRATR